MEYCLFTGLFVIYLMQFSVTCYVTAWLQTIEFNLRLHYSLCISYQSSVILLSDKHNSLSLSLYIYIYIYIYICVCVCVCVRARAFSNRTTTCFGRPNQPSSSRTLVHKKSKMGEFCKEKPISFYSFCDPLPYLMMADVDSRNMW